jgi:hypothetical protein
MAHFVMQQRRHGGHTSLFVGGFGQQGAELGDDTVVLVDLAELVIHWLVLEDGWFSERGIRHYFTAPGKET